MSPEQVRNTKDVNAKSDIYSLGVVLWEMVTGKVPYNINTESTFDVFTKIVNEPLLKTGSMWDGIIEQATRKISGERMLKLTFEQAQPIEDTKSNDVFTKILYEPLLKTARWDGIIERATRKISEERVLKLTFEQAKPIEEPKTKDEEAPRNKLFPIIVGIGLTFLLIIGGVWLGNSSKENAPEWKQNFEAESQNEKKRVEEEREIERKGLEEQNKQIGTFTDKRDGKSYKWVKIGDQVWMAENLNVDKFHNGDPIPHAKTNKEWKEAGEKGKPAWCYVENDAVNGKKYGKLYNWYAVKDPRGLAPKGWHIPTDEEWIKVTNNLGGQEESTGRKMQSTFGWKDNDNGTNESGFSGLPAGNRFDTGDFRDLGVEGSWWSSTEYGKEVAFLVTIRGWFSAPDIYSLDKTSGFSVRCLKD
jgi:uncharacterized protein (TIGR02145 family)